MHRIYIILLGTVGMMSLMAAAFSSSQPDADQPAAAVAKGASGESVPSEWHDSSDSKVLTLRRDSSGQFHVDAQVNGESVRFLVDTGADVVALTVEDAEALGLVVGEMQPIMQTASGIGYGAPLMLDEIEVAGTVLHNVQAVVVQDLGVNLLGQSVLRRLGGVELKGDRMVIRAR
jgi:aspartyl protease family protein